jgi:formamidopyrimidine-DNA glycosylase
VIVQSVSVHTRLFEEESMPIASVPERSLEQRMRALEKANRIRSGRAELKRGIKRHEVGLAAVLADPPAHVATMKVLDLLLAQPGVGRVKAGKVLHRCRISPSKAVGGLSRRQRAELVRVLDGHPPTSCW